MLNVRSHCRTLAGIVTAFVLIVDASSIDAQCTVTHGKLGHFDRVTLENRLVRITALPQLGGRIVEYSTSRPEEMMAARKQVGDMIERLRRDVTGEPF
ncbi:MAG: hypothetical protein CMJ18_02030 [Phycisphaeraceae bacterium]|nr:hypothetical protein [Phycisphaeraceae bacterium]